jgi:phage terminase large subunit GpA-like protein
VLSHHVIWGPADSDLTWADLDSALKTIWRHPAGGILTCDACVIDSGDGGHADLVHGFTRSRFARRVVSGKGVGGMSRPFLARSSTKGAPLFIVGVDAIKAQLFNRLARGNAFRFSADLEPIFFDQLCSERRVVKYFKGQPVRRFERIAGKQAETLDATVYALAARQLIGMNLDRREEELASVTLPKKPATVIKSAWLNR